MKTVVVNLIGGAGLGKSTTAALLFGEMKQRGLSCELVREFVKDWAWMDRKPTAIDQSIIYGHQLERESLLYGKVEFIITDCPLLLCGVYRAKYYGNLTMANLVVTDLNEAKARDVTHVNFLLGRNKPFDPRGRWGTEADAREIDRAIKTFLDYWQFKYVNLDCPDEERIDTILKHLEVV